MTVRVHFPEDVEAKEVLDNNFSEFHSTLIIEGLKNLNLDTNNEKIVLSQLLNYIKGNKLVTE